MKTSEISKIISHALRHEPWLYELEIDDNGWVPISELISAVNNVANQTVDVLTIQKIINDTDKPRFEIVADKIRAIYGHSMAKKLNYIPSVPPEFLFHGTNASLMPTIMRDGLKPMDRQYVHLSTDKDIARAVALRKGKDIVILTISAQNAHNAKCKFYEGNKYVWLSDYVDPMYILANY